MGWEVQRTGFALAAPRSDSMSSLLVPPRDQMHLFETIGATPNVAYQPGQGKEASWSSAEACFLVDHTTVRPGPHRGVEGTCRGGLIGWWYPSTTDIYIPSPGDCHPLYY